MNDATRTWIPLPYRAGHRLFSGMRAEIVIASTSSVSKDQGGYEQLHTLPLLYLIPLYDLVLFIADEGDHDECGADEGGKGCDPPE